MKERPILFSGPMVRAILEGRKTQTRRILKPQPIHRVIEAMAGVTRGMDNSKDGDLWYDCDGINPGREVNCPYGQAGDQIWVRETWCYKMEGGSFVYNANGDYACHYKADGDYVEAVDDDGFMRYTRKGYEASPWRPSIHMPRWASRITLEIESVRVERLHEITEEDAKAEGVTLGEDRSWAHREAGLEYKPHVIAFSSLWQSINGKGSWDANPWVWVIQFKRMEAK